MNPLLEANALEVRFGDLFSVGPVSFSMGPGLLYVAGPNGGGKTTLLRALVGELLPFQGEVQVNGNIVHKSVIARRQIALVPSIPELPGFLTVSEAYQFTASLRQAPSWDGSPFCEQLNLDRNLPLANASAGQRRKAELVCGLAGDPPVLLLDETFGHLDHQSCTRLQGWLAEWSRSRLIVLTHHGGAPVSVSATLAESVRSVIQDRCTTCGVQRLAGVLVQARARFGRRRRPGAQCGRGTALGRRVWVVALFGHGHSILNGTVRLARRDYGF